ncbi:helix-turn-helix domain-containing protein [Brevibacterium sp. 91QC2O2]|uniref:IclR family transcriptional regulator n=1 Tax=Brevibacterium sp. 91QC2O2 TaxID=2968458 RepID=UPI00211B8CB1|nr:IclR family transcriptional regulator C-terminal domain-containing protein [Brevibacterium sp. 91QC2O2]MCQ9368199.1 helix-turn-helix domain-containing protein [Brevibacterium sp. 91QC2O2]
MSTTVDEDLLLASDPASAPAPTASPSPEPCGTVHRAIAILEAVAEHGSSTAKSISEHTGIPVPTVYRLAKELCAEDYLVHLRQEKRFALGYRLHRLAGRLHADLGVRPAVRREIDRLHAATKMAAYLAIHRGSEFVVAYVADSPACPRIKPMKFGFRENPHATAFGKLGLSDADSADRIRILGPCPLPNLTPKTLTTTTALDEELERVATSGIAWEYEEFSPGTTCAAVPLRDAAGTLIGSVAVSAPSPRYRGQRTHVEHLLRAAAERTGRIYRLGA